MKLAKIAVLSLLALALAAPAVAGPAGSVPPVLLADFDDDGQTDVLVEDSSGRLWVYLTAADGISFSGGGSPVVVPGGFSVVGVADLNADGRADVLVQDGSGLLYTYITAAGGITFDSGASGSPVTIPAGFSFVAANDFDGDSAADILVEEDSTGLLYVFINGGAGISVSGGGAPVTLPGGFSVASAADYNGDGLADVLVKDGSGLLYTYITAAGGVTFSGGGSPVTIPAGFAYVGSGDYTADATGALNDIVVFNSTTDLVYIYATGADGISVDTGSSGSPVTLVSGYSIVGIADFTGDGTVDTLIENGSKLLYVFKHSGPATIDTGASGSPVTIPGTFDLSVPITL